ncbi:MAG: ABC transporter permease [Actinomycetia bacterium]|nr:ABC transporter permease [Actinomycetes bacterium]MCP4226460.1 ABC transporter permease [Actinomycetes bacterium]MCP5034710.1 ABC transporter permease [Actinomycetes bacterium]
MIIFTLLNERFIFASNLSLMTQQTVIVGTLAIAQTLIILTAGIDLSIGAIMVFGQMMMANLAVTAAASNVAGIGLPAPLAIAVGLLIALIAGTANGYLIVRFKLPPFIVTLGTLSIFTALSLILFKARTIQGPELPDLLKVMGTSFKVGPFAITTGVLVMLGLYAVFAYVLRNTAWGTHLYAVGDDPDAAELSGINTNRILLSVYAVAGLIMGIAAWITIGRVGSASPNVAPDINLASITAVVIGGTSLFGGRGTMIGTLLGALIVTVVRNGLALADLDQAYRVLAIGILVITAVALDQWIRRVKA